MTTLFVKLALDLVQRYGARILGLLTGFFAGRRSARAAQMKRTITHASKAAKSDRRVRDAVRRGDGDRLRAKWTRRR